MQCYIDITVCTCCSDSCDLKCSQNTLKREHKIHGYTVVCHITYHIYPVLCENVVYTY